MNNIERLDGFTADGFGKVIPGAPQTGDVIRVDGRIEQRYTEITDVILTPPEKPPEPTKAELLAKVEELLTAVQALK